MLCGRTHAHPSLLGVTPSTHTTVTCRSWPQQVQISSHWLEGWDYRAIRHPVGWHCPMNGGLRRWEGGGRLCWGRVLVHFQLLVTQQTPQSEFIIKKRLRD